MFIKTCAFLLEHGVYYIFNKTFQLALCFNWYCYYINLVRYILLINMLYTRHIYLVSLIIIYFKSWVMAKQVGIIPLVGTIDGVNFYMRKGKPVARKAGGGFTGKAIRNSASMERVRENNNEFGHCSRVKKLFKDSLFPFLGKQRNEELQSRLMKLFIEIKNADLVSERGQRLVKNGLQSAEGKALFADFCFTSFNLPSENGFYDAASTTYTFSDFAPKSLKFLASATHLELQLGVVVLDLEAMKATLFTSDVVRVPKNGAPQAVTLTATVPNDASGFKIAVLHYRYLQDVNGAFYGFQEQKGFGLLVVGV